MDDLWPWRYFNRIIARALTNRIEVLLIYSRSCIGYSAISYILTHNIFPIQLPAGFAIHKLNQSQSPMVYENHYRYFCITAFTLSKSNASTFFPPNPVIVSAMHKAL